MMRKLIILRGNSGSGKTSVAVALQRKFGNGTMLISHDMVRLDILNVRSREGVVKSQSLMITLLKYGKDNSEITIIEGILPAKDYSRLFETAVKEYGKNIFAYYYDLPFEETLIRHRTKQCCNEFGESEMKCWWHEMDLLPMIREKVIKQDLKFQDTVEMIYGDVTGEKSPFDR